MDLLMLRRRMMFPKEKDYIQFVDPVVEQICATTWGDGVGLTYAQAANVTQVPNSLFSGNTQIVSFDEFVYFTNCVKIFGANNSSAGFINCTSLKSITFPNSLTTFQSNNQFSGCTSLESVKNCKVTAISSYAFQMCTSLVEIDISHAVSIGQEAFRSVPLTGYKLNVPNLSQTSLAGAFCASGITEIVNLGSVQQLVHGAYSRGCFQDCTALVKAVLPTSLTDIGRNCFNGCSSLEEITLPGSTVVTLNSLNPLAGCTSLAHIYVPAALVNDYATASGWSSYSSIIEAIPV